MPWRQEVYLEVYSTFFPVLSWFHLALLELKSAKNAFIFLESYQLSWCFSLFPIIWTSFFPWFSFLLLFPYYCCCLFACCFCSSLFLCVLLVFFSLCSLNIFFLILFPFFLSMSRFFPQPIFTQTVSNTQTCLLTSKLVIATMNGSNQNKYMQMHSCSCSCNNCHVCF